MSFSVRVNPANPGQFFACCGLMELASRCGGGPTGRFEDGWFRLEGGVALSELLAALKAAPVTLDADETDAQDGEEEEESENAAPLLLGGPFALRLDWWADPTARGMKVWAGSMNGPAIFRSMVKAIPTDAGEGLFATMAVILDADNPKKKKEPFYFDARRGEQADTRDIGFSPDKQSVQTRANAAIEALTLIGLQRFRPLPSDTPRVFTYNVWRAPLPLLAAAVHTSVLLGGVPSQTYRFESAFRTSQRKHKAFMMATLIGEHHVHR